MEGAKGIISAINGGVMIDGIVHGEVRNGLDIDYNHCTYGIRISIGIGNKRNGVRDWQLEKALALYCVMKWNLMILITEQWSIFIAYIIDIIERKYERLNAIQGRIL